MLQSSTASLILIQISNATLYNLDGFDCCPVLLICNHFGLDKPWLHRKQDQLLVLFSDCFEQIGDIGFGRRVN